MSLDDPLMAYLRHWEGAAAALQRDLVRTGAARSVRIRLVRSGADEQAHPFPARIRCYVDDLLCQDEFDLDAGSTAGALYQLARSTQDLIADVYRVIWPRCDTHQSFFDVVETISGPIWRCHLVKQHEFLIGTFA